MSNHALIVIDIQNDYFDGGKWPLHNMAQSAENAARILEHARQAGHLVIHVHHEFNVEEPPFFAPGSEGAEIHPSVEPLEDELTVLKHQVNAFHQTPLHELLKEQNVESLTIIGSMSHMCIDAATRAAADLGYLVTVVEDACASRDLEFEGKTVEADDVHAAYMSALRFAYANVVNTAQYLKGI